MYASVAEHYFETIGAPLLKGRAIERADHELKRSVAVVSERFERDFLDGNAIGKEIFFGNDSTWMEIVGVVGDVRTFGLREEIQPMAYLPMTTKLSSTEIGLMYLVVRTTGDPSALIPAVRAAVNRIEPNTPLLAARTMNEVLNASMAETSFTTVILIVAALVALLLGAIGLYGVINYVVSQRTQEIGVRIALGAIPGQVRALVLRQGLTLAAIGIVIGLAGAVALTRLLGTLLYEVNSRDPITFALVALVMLGVSSFAAYVPARRASAVSPLQALRSD
jgi:predicted permease